MVDSPREREEMGGGFSNIPVSNKGLIESVENNPLGKNLGASLLLARKLRESKGRLRSEFKGISLSECKKLREFAERYLFVRKEFWPLPDNKEGRDHVHSFYHEVVLELRSMEDELEKYSNANALPSSPSSIIMPTSPLQGQSQSPVPNPDQSSAPKLNHDQLLIPLPSATGLVTNQNGYVSGSANGSVIIIHDCKFSY